jgi:RimJ/RimL family protein N-acetyltransferase
MALHTTTDVDEIKRLLADALADDPVANTMFSSIRIGLDQAGADPWAAHLTGEPLVLAARSRRDRLVVLTPSWEDVAELAAAIAELDPPAAGVAAEPTVIDALIAGIGRAATWRIDERLFRLDELVPPPDVAGSARPATGEDLDLLGPWFADFVLETFGRTPPDFDSRSEIERALETATCWLWTVDGGPVSFAHQHAPVDGVARIGPVYTPPSLRRNGYASAATSAAARQILDGGAVACLYTDLANPTSNRIYQALGFRPVLDRCAVRFD